MTIANERISGAKGRVCMICLRTCITVPDFFTLHTDDSTIKLITTMAEIIQKSINAKELAMRYGGDEFVIMGNRTT